MLIYDRFPNLRAAADFLASSEREGAIYTTPDAANEADPFPFTLRAPVVHVERYDTDGPDEENHLEALAVAVGGNFAGT